MYLSLREYYEGWRRSFRLQKVVQPPSSSLSVLDGLRSSTRHRMVSDQLIEAIDKLESGHINESKNILAACLWELNELDD